MVGGRWGRERGGGGVRLKLDVQGQGGGESLDVNVQFGRKCTGGRGLKN